MFAHPDDRAHDAGAGRDAAGTPGAGGGADGATAGCPLPRIVTAFTPRLAELAFEPSLVAAVDQHVAEVRELLYAQGPALRPLPVDRAELSGYAAGFLEALTEIGWREPVGYDFAVHRLTAISWLVREHRLLAG
ncbi:DUF6401 family natural product biosynthesis protein [Kitasatospora sp. NPDC004240]